MKQVAMDKTANGKDVHNIMVGGDSTVIWNCSSNHNMQAEEPDSAFLVVNGLPRGMSSE